MQKTNGGRGQSPTPPFKRARKPTLLGLTGLVCQSERERRDWQIDVSLALLAC